MLVSSASHLPRAVGLMKKLGMGPIPAPCDYRADEHAGLDLDDVFPSGVNWQKLDRAWHEYLGMAAAKLLGRM